MRSPVCYLAHPVDFQEDFAPVNADYIRRGLLDAGFVVYSPARAFSVPPDAEPGPAIWQVDQLALQHCDALVAMFPEDRTVGVPMELQRAIDLGLPVLVIVRDRNRRSWALAGLPDSVRIVRWPGRDADFTWLEGKAAARVLSEPAALAEPLYVRIDEQGQLPTRAYSGDAGFDLYTVSDWTIQPDATADVPCGVAVQLPDRVWGLIVGRSSTLRKHNLLVSPGIIDTGWRGQLFAGVRNLGTAAFEVKRGMRLAQLIPLPNLAAGLVPTSVEQLSSSDRGEAGFGSSGE